MVTVLHAGGWRVESCWLDLDGCGERAWNRATDRHGVVRWLTTAQLQEALHRDGLDVGDLVLEHPARPVGGRGDECE
ncbi:hypothetical protein ACFFX1_55240 [Dactylosporangium sucinum]|uniref:hypothetical protein n=1 Tax=Dactylosporangium sucinum TaxID=1424081 RepID=UPI00167EAA22|nr:hypothetical protein [Dactylosporangium sucinum]